MFALDPSVGDTRQTLLWPRGSATVQAAILRVPPASVLAGVGGWRVPPKPLSDAKTLRESQGESGTPGTLGTLGTLARGTAPRLA